jgi:hypothetical protein
MWLQGSGGWVMSMHYYNGQDSGTPYLRLMRMTIGAGGWPELAPMMQNRVA